MSFSWFPRTRGGILHVTPRRNQFGTPERPWLQVSTPEGGNYLTCHATGFTYNILKLIGTTISARDGGFGNGAACLTVSSALLSSKG